MCFQQQSFLEKIEHHLLKRTTVELEGSLRKPPLALQRRYILLPCTHRSRGDDACTPPARTEAAWEHTR
jgi:hypothetical protein